MKSGVKPNKVNHKDFDYLKSRHPELLAGAVGLPAFPAEYLVDAGLWMPDQRLPQAPIGMATIPEMDEGCTNYAQADLANDLTRTLTHSPNDLEAVTHANARGGAQIRDSLLACLPPSSAHPERLGWFTNFYNIRPSGIIDAFNAFCLAIVSAKPEMRSVTFGTPWFPSWETAAQAGQFVMPMPTPAELALAKRDPAALPWHDSKLDGWTTPAGAPVLRDKSWQGKNIGNGGFVAFDRATINTLMAISGVVGFTATMQTANSPKTIDVTVVQWIVSLVRNLLGYK